MSKAQEKQAEQYDKKKHQDEQQDNAKKQAEAQFDSIKELLENVKNAKTDEEREDAETAIHEDPLSAEVKKKYEILLCWGGPACRIIGDLDEHNEPETAQLQYQDWFTTWTEYPCDEETLLEYTRYFYFEQ